MCIYVVKYFSCLVTQDEVTPFQLTVYAHFTNRQLLAIQYTKILHVAV